MANSFLLTIADAQSKLDKIRNSNKSVAMTGDVVSGTIAISASVGNVIARYKCLGDNKYEIDITNKPMMIPMSMIEAQIKKGLA